MKLSGSTFYPINRTVHLRSVLLYAAYLEAAISRNSALRQFGPYYIPPCSQERALPVQCIPVSLLLSTPPCIIHLRFCTVWVRLETHVFEDNIVLGVFDWFTLNFQGLSQIRQLSSELDP